MEDREVIGILVRDLMRWVPEDAPTLPLYGWDPLKCEEHSMQCIVRMGELGWRAIMEFVSEDETVYRCHFVMADASRTPESQADTKLRARAFAILAAYGVCPSEHMAVPDDRVTATPISGRESDDGTKATTSAAIA